MSLTSSLTNKLTSNKSPVHTATVTHEYQCKIYKSVISPDEYNKKQVLDYVMNLYQTEAGIPRENLMCWQSNYLLHRQTNVFDELIKVLNQRINFFKELKHGYKLKVHEIWAAAYKKGEYAKLHGHGKFCQFSGVLYLNSEEGHPGITFEDNFTLPCSENTAYFFDSTYKHAVAASELDSLRIILGFNFYLILPD